MKEEQYKGKLEKEFVDLKELAKAQDIWPDGEIHFCCMAIQNCESWGFSDGDPMGITKSKCGLLFLMSNRFHWIFPQKEKTFWSGGTTTSFEIQVNWKFVVNINIKGSLLGKKMIFDTKSGDKSFTLNLQDSLVSSSPVMKIANNLLTTSIESKDDSSTSSTHQDIPLQIKKLSELRDSGILTDKEFEDKKAELLNKM